MLGRFWRWCGPISSQVQIFDGPPPDSFPARQQPGSAARSLCHKCCHRPCHCHCSPKEEKMAVRTHIRTWASIVSDGKPSRRVMSQSAPPVLVMP